jgi:hypothetical protein
VIVGKTVFRITFSGVFGITLSYIQSEIIPARHFMFFPSCQSNVLTFHTGALDPREIESTAITGRFKVSQVMERELAQRKYFAVTREHAREGIMSKCQFM